MTYIAIEGVIGAGKSTLARKICHDLDLRMMAEPVDDNPFLALFYDDPKRWAACMQFFLLQHRYRQQMVAAHSDITHVLDRSLPGDRVFAKLHMRYGNMHELEWKLYEQWYATMTAVRSPFLMVYLEVDPQTALARVKQRARGVEGSVGLSYLADLHDEYTNLIREIESGKREWARGITVLRVPWDADVGHDLGASPQYQDLAEEITRYIRRKVAE